MRSGDHLTYIIAPDFPATRLLLVEVYTPGGNWSSWPPHKHDQDAMPREAVLEEVYFCRFRRPAADWAIRLRIEGWPLFGSFLGSQHRPPYPSSD